MAHIQILVDTGAAVTVVSTEFYHNILSTSSPLEHSQVLQSVKTANGARIPIEGIATFDLGLGQTKYGCSAYVVSGLSNPVVLGRDFLQQNRAIINMGTHTVEFLCDDVLKFANENTPLSLLPVKCGKTQVIDAHSEAAIPATVSQTPNNVVGLIEAGERLLDRYHLAGAASLVCPDISGNIPFRLLNPTNNPVTVFHGATLGHFTTSGFDISPSHSCTLPPCAPLPTTTQQETQYAIIYPVCSKALPPPMDPSPPSVSHHNPTATTPDPLDLSQSVLSQPGKQALSELLAEYADILPQSTTSLGRTNLVQHKIDVGSSPPIRQQPYRAPHAQRREIENHVSDMLQARLIQPSNSPWSAPVVLLRKKDGSTNSREICLSMRKIRLRGRVEIACAAGNLKTNNKQQIRAAFLVYLTLY